MPTEFVYAIRVWQKEQTTIYSEFHNLDYNLVPIQLSSLVSKDELHQYFSGQCAPTVSVHYAVCSLTNTCWILSWNCR